MTSRSSAAGFMRGRAGRRAVAAILYGALRRDDGMHTSKSGGSPASQPARKRNACPSREIGYGVQVGEILD